MSVNGRPFCSVLVPVYNHARYVGHALDTLRAQTDPDWEAVVVDDGSTDATPQVVEAYARRDRRIRVFHKPNGGVSTALNLGLREARGEWIHWLSSDDLFVEHRLATLRRASARHPRVRFFFTDFATLEDATGRLSDAPALLPVPAREWYVVEMLRGIFINGITACWHRELAERAGCFDEALRYGQDYDYWLRLLARGEGMYLHERLSIMRCHPRQVYQRQPWACLFDCARAAIGFLNTHSFTDLFPLLDLDDPVQAYLALTRALAVAASPAAYVYALGPHTALLGRVLEWLCSVPHSLNPRLLRREFGQRARAVCALQRGTPLATVWKAATLAAAGARSGDCRYQPVAAEEVAARHVGSLRPREPAVAEALAAYLRAWTGTVVPSGAPAGRTLDVLVTGEVAEAVLGALATQGHLPMLVRRGPNGLSMRRGVPEVQVRSWWALWAGLASVPPADVACGTARTAALRGPATWRRPLVGLAEQWTPVLDGTRPLPRRAPLKALQYHVWRWLGRMGRGVAGLTLG